MKSQFFPQTFPPKIPSLPNSPLWGRCWYCTLSEASFTKNLFFFFFLQSRHIKVGWGRGILSTSFPCLSWLGLGLSWECSLHWEGKMATCWMNTYTLSTMLDALYTFLISFNKLWEKDAHTRSAREKNWSPEQRLVPCLWLLEHRARTQRNTRLREVLILKPVLALWRVPSIWQ